MKHIRSINEFYHRTVGFRYSNPTEKYSVICYYSGNVSKDWVIEVLNDIRASYEDVAIEEGQETIRIEGEDIKIDGTIYFDVLVYTNKEIDKILSDLGSALYADYGVKVIDFSVRPYPKNTQQE